MKEVFIFLALFLSGCFEMTDGQRKKMNIGNDMSMPKSMILENDHSGFDVMKKDKKVIRVEDNDGIPQILFGVRF